MLDHVPALRGFGNRDQIRNVRATEEAGQYVRIGVGHGKGEVPADHLGHLRSARNGLCIHGPKLTAPVDAEPSIVGEANVNARRGPRQPDYRIRVDVEVPSRVGEVLDAFHRPRRQRHLLVDQEQGRLSRERSGGEIFLGGKVDRQTGPAQRVMGSVVDRRMHAA